MREFPTRWAIGLTVLTVLAVLVLAQPWRRLTPEPSSYQPWIATPASAAIPTNHPVVATAGRSRPVALLVGDSYSEGTGASTPKRGYAALLAADLGWDVTVKSSSGGGYVSPGRTNNGPLARIIAASVGSVVDPDVVILQSGINDLGFTNDQVRQGMRDAFAAVRKNAPHAQIVVIGMFWPGDKNESVMSRSSTIAGAGTQLGAVAVLDPIAGGWTDFHTVDGRHPDDAGHRLIADKIEGGMRSEKLIT